MAKKILFICNVLSHIKAFHLPYIDWFHQQGYEVHVMANAGGEKAPFCDRLYDIDVSRSPFNMRNISAMKKAKKIIEFEKYDLIHCHTPMGGVVGRLCTYTTRKRGTQILYTSHGFHFYKDSPLVNWIFYFPVEWLLSRMTDCIITINEEDYRLAKKYFKSKQTEVYKINGIGVDTHKFNKYSREEKNKLKQAMGFSVDDIILFYAAEFIDRKNHQYIINRAKELKAKIPNVKILLAGRGIKLDKIKQAIKNNNIEDCVQLLGFRKDIPDLLNISDVLISPSKQEGLPINIVEGMAAGVPIVASNIRGHKDLVRNNVNGYLFDLHDGSFVDKVFGIVSDLDRWELFSNKSVELSKDYSIEKVKEQMASIYLKYL